MKKTNLTGEENNKVQDLIEILAKMDADKM